MKISQAARRNIDEAKTLVRKWAVEDDSEETTLYQDILRDMVKSYSDVYDPSKINEDTFVKDTLTPILKNYFPNDQLISTEGANGEIIGSKERKKTSLLEMVLIAMTWNYMLLYLKDTVAVFFV
ncbi:hypothetical protein BDB00DRAFT_903165 [Zychaea mexicana]|uniref:uncharacterized protein n=1 Tax=Zychaea mexicana TaxID=64656 RepID=UPI0022FDD2E0|nr:uncharacterized protein BDB00DRAFT_903165 [Zychaea mexicana]KAI9467538.1 hypothetical protein BDB00DRAFT_903165 [Zychaea mexicana]